MARRAFRTNGSDWALAASAGALVVALDAFLRVPVAGVGYAFATAAVFAVALATGAGPALVSTAIVVAGAILAYPGRATLAADRDERLRLTVFVAAGVAAAWMGGVYRRARRRSEDILASISDGFVVFDAGWRLTWANATAVEAAGRRREELLGRSFPELFPELAATQPFVEPFVRVMRERRASSFTTRFGGRWFEVRAAPLREGGISVWFRDVSARRESEEALRQRERELVEADRRKDEFLALLSHELRNPLAPIRNGLVLLERSHPSDPRIGRLLAVVDRQVNHLSRLVDDLLDVTRITRGKIRVAREPVDVAGLVRRTAEDLRSLFDANRITLTLETPEAPVWVTGDAARLAQVTGNILQNAAKFTPRSGRVDVEVARRGGGVTLRVADTGVGIEPGMLEAIFEPFSQADRSLDRTRGGLGLGLALARAIVALHGGTIRAESAGPGRGATFIVALPEGTAPAEAPAAGAEAPSPAAPLRIVLVEDNRDAADTLREVLEMDGHDVAVAYSGPHGLRLVRERRPDVVLCDVGLPGMDGYEVARTIRGDPALAGTHLVALTGYALPEDRRRAAEAGFERHLAKPPDVSKLEALLASFTRAA